MVRCDHVDRVGQMNVDVSDLPAKIQKHYEKVVVSLIDEGVGDDIKKSTRHAR
jgi:hypothetical protein